MPKNKKSRNQMKHFNDRVRVHAPAPMSERKSEEAKEVKVQTVPVLSLQDAQSKVYVTERDFVFLSVLIGSLIRGGLGFSSVLFAHALNSILSTFGLVLGHCFGEVQLIRLYKEEGYITVKDAVAIERKFSIPAQPSVFSFFCTTAGACMGQALAPSFLLGSTIGGTLGHAVSEAIATRTIPRIG